MDSKLRDQIDRILNDATDMTLATIRPDGFPQATTVAFVRDGLTLYMGCGADSQKAANIERNPKISAAVDGETEEWGAITGLSLGGTAERVTDAEELDKIGKLLVAKFPQIANMEPLEPGDVAFFRIIPLVFSVLDYTKGFGHTDLVRVEAGDCTRRLSRAERPGHWRPRKFSPRSGQCVAGRS